MKKMKIAGLALVFCMKLSAQQPDLQLRYLKPSATIAFSGARIFTNNVVHEGIIEDASGGSFVSLHVTDKNPKHILVSIEELNGYPTVGTITVRILKMTAFDISFDPVGGMSDVFGGGMATSNAAWTFIDNPGNDYYELVSTAPVQAHGTDIIALTITKKPTTCINTTQSMTARITPGSGGENNFSNNVSVINLTTN